LQEKIVKLEIELEDIGKAAQIFHINQSIISQGNVNLRDFSPQIETPTTKPN